MDLDPETVAQWDLFWERLRSRSSDDRFADRYDWSSRAGRDPTPRVDRAPLDGRVRSETPSD